MVNVIIYKGTLKARSERIAQGHGTGIAQGHGTVAQLG